MHFHTTFFEIRLILRCSLGSSAYHMISRILDHTETSKHRNQSFHACSQRHMTVCNLFFTAGCTYTEMHTSRHALRYNTLHYMRTFIIGRDPSSSEFSQGPSYVRKNISLRYVIILHHTTLHHNYMYIFVISTLFIKQ
jgi:hypothetical protein